MMQLIEFIFSNPLFIFIIFALISFFTNQQKKERKNDKRENVERHTKTETIPNRREQKRPKPVKDIQMSIEELRQQQLERLTQNIQSQVSIEAGHDDKQIDEKKSSKVIEQNVVKRPQIKSNFSGRLTKEGLVDSIIMKEVLGRPRALKPYQFRQMNND